MLKHTTVRVDEVGSILLNVRPPAGKLCGEEVASSGQRRWASDESAFAYLERYGRVVAWRRCAGVVVDAGAGVLRLPSGVLEPDLTGGMDIIRSVGDFCNDGGRKEQSTLRS